MVSISNETIMKLVIENSTGGFLVINPQGYIIFINKGYEEFLGRKAKDIIGKYVKDILPNTRLPIVAETGIPEFGAWQKQGDKYLCGNRIPLYLDGHLVGVMAQLVFQNPEEVKVLIDQLSQMRSKLEYYKEELHNIWSSKHSFDTIVGQSKEIMDTIRLAQKAANSDSTVLIMGETGVGKEVFASAIHSHSRRAKKPFIKVNCAAIPYELLESELFGYEEGAFSGAKKGGKPGKFELAQDGTIFLDEIGELPLKMQPKLLRVLQEKEIERVGGVKTIKVNACVITATNKNLEGLVKEGSFRSDLFYRLNVIPITIPPLRERREDIPLYVDFALKKVTAKHKRGDFTIRPEVIKALVSYSWPGNVRELFNVLEQMINLCDGNELTLQDIPPAILGREGIKNQRSITSLKSEMEEAEREILLRALEEAKGNKNMAAKLLGIHRITLYDKLKKYSIYYDSET